MSSSATEIADEAELLSIDDTLPLRNVATKAVVMIRNLTDVPLNVAFTTRRGTPLRRVDGETIIFGAKNKRISVRPTRAAGSTLSKLLSPVARVVDPKAAEIERLRKLGITPAQPPPPVDRAAKAKASVEVKLTAKVGAARAARGSAGAASIVRPVSASPNLTHRVIQAAPATPPPATLATPPPTPPPPQPVIPPAPEPVLEPAPEPVPEPTPEPAPVPELKPDPEPDPEPLVPVLDAVRNNDKPTRSGSFGAFLGRAVSSVVAMLPSVTAAATTAGEASTALVPVSEGASDLMSRAIAAVALSDDPAAAHAEQEGEEPIGDISEAELGALKARVLERTLAPFQVDAKTAMQSFEAWKKSLWFVPEDFIARLELAQCRAIFVPYYVFAAAATSVHVGSVGFVEGTGREPRWLDAQEAMTCQHVKQMRTWALVEGDASAVPLRVLLELDDGFDVTLARPDAPALAEPSLLGAAVDWKEAFAKRVYKDVVRNERYGAADALRKEHHAQLVRGRVRTETTLTNVSLRLVYLPLYAFGYEYQGGRYAFAVNGQTGAVHGERPYGVGSTKVSTLRALTGNFLGGTDRVRLVTGDELAAEDQVRDCYGGAASFYLLLPSSDQFLLVFSIGWIVLGNAGAGELVLRAQRRMRAPAAEQPECRLAPTERKRFSFSGHWIVRIVAGNAADLRCLASGTSGGDATQDELKMCA